MSAPRPPSVVWPLLGACLLGAIAARLAPWLAGAGRAPTAFLGIGASVAAALAGLVLKRLALERGVRQALKATGWAFLLRLLLLALGAVWVRSHGQSVTVFGVAFLTLFGALQWLEIGYVVVASRRQA